jgi:deoxyribonuclease V
MKLPPPLHRWPTTAKAAVRLQERLAGTIRIRPLVQPVRLVAGADLAFSPDGDRCLAGLSVFDISTHALVEEVLAWRPVRFPYVPGLLTFREAPAVLAAARKLECTPDLFMFDGQGYAHPRRFGLATHTGMLLGRPSVGCAKTRLCGEEADPPPAAGASVPLIHRGEVVGAILRTQARCKPVYVSVGNDVTLNDAIALVMSCVTRYRLPEPTRLAHQLVTRHRTLARPP